MKTLNFGTVKKELEAFKAKCSDHYVPLELIEYTAKEDGDRFKLLSREFGFTQTGISQFCSYLGINGAFFSRCNVENRNGLFAQFHPTAVEENPGTELFVREYDGRVRGVLSSNYGVFDDVRLIEMLERIIGGKMNELKVTEFFKNENGRKMFLSLIWQNDNISLGTIDGQPDIYKRGLKLHNSEIGGGSIRLEPMLFRQWCSNGAVRQVDGQSAIMRHYGDPVKLEKKIGGLFWNLEKFYGEMQASIKRANQEKIVKIEIEKLIRETAKKYGVSEKTEAIVNAFNKEKGDTKAHVANAFTRAAHESFEGESRYELESIGQQIIDSDITKLIREIEENEKKREQMKEERADIKAWATTAV